jgi:prepilin-type N-terminal cleavage/methylation domain-containing protein
MKKGVSLPEISIALLIIAISLVVFLTLASNYLRTVKNASELFIMDSLAQEGLELAIAWRNKQIEVPFGSTTPPPTINGNYCISFSGNNINLQRSPRPCQVSFLGPSPNINYYRILNFRTDSNIISVVSSVNSSIWRSPSIELNTILTPWHIVFP